MTDILYALTPIMCAVLIEIFLNRTLALKQGDSANSAFVRLLVVSFMFCFIDIFCGFLMSGILKWGAVTLRILCYCFHFIAAVVGFMWLVYVEIYLGMKHMGLQIALGIVPFMLQMGLLVSNFYTGAIFVIEEPAVYVVGKYRIVLVILEYAYFIFADIMTIIHYITTADAYRRKRCISVMVFTTVPIAAGILQLLYPYAPFYSVGFTLGCAVIFVYNVSSEHEHMLALEYQMTKLVSRRNHDTVNALSEIYRLTVLINLEDQSIRVVQKTPETDAITEGDLELGEKLVKLSDVRGDTKIISEFREFASMETLARRLLGKATIYHEFLSRNFGWCRAGFIRVDDNEEGNLKNVIFTIQQIDEEKRREIEYQQALAKALENQNEVYAEMLQVQSNGIIAVDMNNKILKLNDAAAKMFGYPGSDAFDGDIRTIINKCESERKSEILQSYAAMKTIGGRIGFEFSICNDGLNYIYIMATSMLAVMTSGERIIITSLTNITKNKKLERELTQLSETDALTGIRNRGSGERKINQLLEIGKEGMFALMDIDKFKTINDTFGHGVGDKVLIAMAGCLSHAFRGADIVMRLGGDEFAVFAVGIKKYETAKMCIERLFDEVNQIDIEEMRDSGRRVSISLGAVLCKAENMKSFDELYQLADAAMYQSKKVEGNHYGIG